jgi:hypothetical protein
MKATACAVSTNGKSGRFLFPFPKQTKKSPKMAKRNKLKFQIIVGNNGITPDQARAQMSIWSIWSSPLIMSNDLRDMSPGHTEILLNKYVIAVDQDPLGIMGRMVVQVTFLSLTSYMGKGRELSTLLLIGRKIVIPLLILPKIRKDTQGSPLCFCPKFEKKVDFLVKTHIFGPTS